MVELSQFCIDGINLDDCRTDFAVAAGFGFTDFPQLRIFAAVNVIEDFRG